MSNFESILKIVFKLTSDNILFIVNEILPKNGIDTNEALDSITDWARGLVGKRGVTAMRELFFFIQIKKSEKWLKKRGSTC